jgi:hypothetical protein
VNSRIQTLARKLELLRQKDTAYSIFGSRPLFGGHGYQLNPALSENEVLTFERLHQIRLPDDYRDFLTTIGNGGAGPGNGLESLSSDLGNGLLALPFPHVSAWNFSILSDDDGFADDEYFNDKHIQGTVPLVDYGCNIYARLVIVGSARNSVWIDDRGNDGGICPDDGKFNSPTPAVQKLDFAAWYEHWLDASLAHFR